jgi:hypothetical protein
VVADNDVVSTIERGARKVGQIAKVRDDVAVPSLKQHRATTELFVRKIHGQTRSSRREAVIRRQYRREIRRRTQS